MSIQNSVEVSEDFIASAGMYAFLSRCWSAEIDGSLIQEIRVIFAEGDDVSLAKCLDSEKSIGELEEDLAIDFCQLFLGPKNHIPPSQSVFVSGDLRGESITQMQTFASIVDPQSEIERGSLPNDHAGYQLALMSQICDALSTSSDDAEFENLLELGQAFFHNHLSWVIEISKKLYGKAETEFYRKVFELTVEFLESEQYYFLQDTDNRE